MRLPLLISLSALLLLLSWQRAGAQIAPADDFFHSGAQFYISNNIPQAKEVVSMGRKLYPDDDKLKKLEELLNQQQQQQDQSQQNQQNQQQQQQNQNQSQQNQSQQQQQQQQSKSDQEKQNEQQQQQNQANQNKPDQQQQASQQNANQEKSDNQDQQAQAAQAGKMTPEEAKKLLDAQKGNEQLLQWKPGQKPRDTSKSIKDW